MSAQTIRWLHLSDFHVGKDAFGQKQLFTDIHQHVTDQIHKEGALDFVFITGDIANKGLKKEYATFTQDFLTPLRKYLGPQCEVLMVPGNHDVDRNKAKTSARQIMWANKQVFFEPTQDGLEWRDGILPRFSAYQRMHKDAQDWLGHAHGFYTQQHTINGIEVGILGLNTAWLACDDDDERALSPGVSMVRQGLEMIQDCRVKIVLGHHPLSWLHLDDAEPIEAMFERAKVMYLHGHLHRTKANHASAILNIQAGAAFQARDDAVWRNRILWGQVDAVMDTTVSFKPLVWSEMGVEWLIDGDAFPADKQVGQWWVYPLPVTQAIDITPTKTANRVTLEPAPETEMDHFRQMVVRKVEHQMNKPECASLLIELAEHLPAKADTESLASALCQLSDHHLTALLESVKACFDQLELQNANKRPLANAVETMMNWCLLLAVDAEWIKNKGYLSPFEGTDTLYVKIPMSTQTGIEIVTSRINGVASGFQAGHGGHDLPGCGYVVASHEVGWHEPDVVNEVKRALWKSLFQAEPPQTLSAEQDAQLNVSIKSRKITQNKHYLTVPVLDAGNPLNDGQTYALLVQQLPALKVIFIGGDANGVLVLEEPVLMTWVSEILNYLRKD